MNKGIILILIIAYLLRSYNINFPPFTADEARVALRGYVLATKGVDELGRKNPIIFNSLSDYQLPLTSYATAISVKLFGKSDFGVRIPFILIGTLIVWLTYLVASIFNPAKKFALLAAFIIAFSPVLIFLSKIPNETILLTCLFLLLFYILTRENFNLGVVLGIFILLLLTSKMAWFTLLPFTVFTLMFLQKDFSKKSKLTIFSSLLLTVFTIFIFLKIPQSMRSISENNFPIFSSETIKNGIDKLRGQGIESGWPPFLERILFNKLDYLYVGFLHWLSHLNLSSKILIIPFVIGLINLIKRDNRNLKILLGYVVILTFPLLFVYPRKFPEMVVLSLPFMLIITAYGLINIKKFWVGLIIIIIIMFFEVILYLPPGLRPIWIKPIVEESYALSQQGKVALSDNIVEDIIPFFGWHTKVNSEYKFSMIDFPYKFREYELSNIKLIGFDNEFRSCGMDENISLILSNRDLERIQKSFQITIEDAYLDSFNKSVAYRLGNRICIN